MPVPDSVFGERVTSYSVDMEKWIGTLAVVTGASGGIGAGITKTFVKYGINVVGLARRVDKIKDLENELSGQPGKVYALKCDLDDEECILQAFSWIEETLGPISILINNAGIIQPTGFVDGNIDMMRHTLNVNVLAVIICTREAIKSMQKHNIEGYIVNLNSVVGHYVPEMPYPGLNIYPGTKFAITAMTEGLRKELRDKKIKIRVSSISPGLVTSDFKDGFTYEGGLRDGLGSAISLTPEDIANAIMYVLGTPSHVQVHDIMIRVQGEGF